jgi:5-methylcytosine-specific restriction endonuclease McrA
LRARGFCRRCYDARRHSLLRFAGSREHVLARDGYRCTGCGSDRVLVHHRRSGIRPVLATLCVVCHNRVHKTWRPRYGRLNRWLQELWREQHRDLAEQLELPLAGGCQGREVEQAPLFEAA